MTRADAAGLAAAWQVAADLALRTDEVAALLATIMNAGERDDECADDWAAITGNPATAFAAAATVGNAWRTRPTPGVAELRIIDPERAQAYADALADLASQAAGRQPIDLRRVNLAAFLAAAQLRAVGGLRPGAWSPGDTQRLTGNGGASESAPSAARPQAAQPTDLERETGTTDPPESYADLLEELDGLVGLARVKSEIRQQAEVLRVAGLRAERGLKNPEITRHLVFTGSPGTGKTTVARLVARIYRALGLLQRGHLVEVDRGGLVGGYLGQTESKTADVVAAALGGVLFVDEAYALAGDQYGDAAVAALVKAMEDHRDNLVLIVAGYTERMVEFLDVNPGLGSRLRLTIEFPDYSEEELVEIFRRQCCASDYEPTDSAETALRARIRAEPRDESFGNARFVRNCFEAAIVRQAWRLRDVTEPTDAELRQLTAEDIAA